MLQFLCASVVTECSENLIPYRIDVFILFSPGGDRDHSGLSPLVCGLSPATYGLIRVVCGLTPRHLRVHPRYFRAHPPSFAGSPPFVFGLTPRRLRVHSRCSRVRQATAVKIAADTSRSAFSCHRSWCSSGFTYFYVVREGLFFATVTSNLGQGSLV